MTSTAAIGTVVAYQGAVAEKEQVRVRTEQGLAVVALEAFNMPSVTGCDGVSIARIHKYRTGCWKGIKKEGATQCKIVNRGSDKCDAQSQ